MTQSLSDLPHQRFGQKFDVTADFKLSDTLSTLLLHRSCRHYRHKTVSDDVVRTLLAAAFSAPSKSDLQQVSVIRITDQAKLNRLARHNHEVGWIADAPEFMVWCGDNRRIRTLSKWKQHDFANDHLDAFMNAAVDVGIALQSFISAAESIGLGCCRVSQIRDDIEFLSKELALPNWVFPVAGLCVGWPVKPEKISIRLPLEITVHDNIYNDSRLIDETTEYDIRREQADPTEPAQQRLRNKYGVTERYGWPEDKTRQYAEPMRTDFGAYIRKQGFDLA
ncbi:MAG: nitroreductase family protein [Gammaproteobacteria bacterium]|nr:nitroreductase family protein [Gammaproteobacteria bacterium]MDH3466092.1 nitroreductase family protein [Gammaproteobacteria bacterium]